MDSDDEFPSEATETGSDELLSDDNLRLPESASTLVRVHAIRAWLSRRQQESRIAIGTTALSLQQMEQDEPQGTRLRRRELEKRAQYVQQAQQISQATQQRLSAYEEAEELLEDCINHITVGERLLVEYYLMLDELIQNSLQEGATEQTPRLQALAEVQHRVEHVGTPGDDE